MGGKRDEGRRGGEGRVEQEWRWRIKRDGRKGRREK
jgi:hypothetical protein